MISCACSPESGAAAVPIITVVRRCQGQPGVAVAVSRVRLGAERQKKRNRHDYSVCGVCHFPRRSIGTYCLFRLSDAVRPCEYTRLIDARFDEALKTTAPPKEKEQRYSGEEAAVVAEGRDWCKTFRER